MNGMPWLPYLAVEYLDTLLDAKMTVFEWGSGSSTNWLAERVRYVVSVEHNPEWQFEAAENVDLQIILPQPRAIGNDPANPYHYRSRPLGGVNFKEYVSFIDGFEPFDLILIDGRARASCLMHASKKIKPSGFIVIDNTERDYYLAQTGDLFKDWNRVTFYGNGPKNSWKWETTFLQNE